jgi:hypothetical protein
MKGHFCPACGERHGRSLFALVNSSKFSPIKCSNCGNCFHFASWLWLLLLPIVLPVGLVGGTGIVFSLVFAGVYLLGWLGVAENSAPKLGPKYG